MNILKAGFLSGGVPQKLWSRQRFWPQQHPKANARMMNAAGGGGDLRDPWAISNSLPALFSQGRNARFFIKGPPCSLGIQYLKKKQVPDSLATLCP